MKKYLTTLAAMALAIGGFIIFEGCTKAPDLTGDTTGEKQEDVISAEDGDKGAEEEANNLGDPK